MGGLAGPSPPPPALQEERLRGGEGLDLGRAGLDSVKLAKVICDFNKAEGLRGISCLGDGGRRWIEMHSWPGGPRARRGPWGGRLTHRPTAPRSEALVSKRLSQPLEEQAKAGLPTRVHTHTYTHTHACVRAHGHKHSHSLWQDTVPYACVHKILKVKADVI